MQGNALTGALTATASRRRARPLAGLNGLYPLLVSMLTIVLLWAGFGSLESLGRFVSGDRVIVARSTNNLGQVTPLSQSRVRFKVANFQPNRIHILGCQSGCSCTVVQTNFPMEIPRGGSKPIEVLVKAPENQGEFTYPLMLFTDTEVNPRVPLIVKGVVMNR